MAGQCCNWTLNWATKGALFFFSFFFFQHTKTYVIYTLTCTYASLGVSGAGDREEGGRKEGRKGGEA